MDDRQGTEHLPHHFHLVVYSQVKLAFISPQGSLSRRLHGLISDVEAYSLQSGTERVIGYLLRQDTHESAESGPNVVTLPTSKAIVASRLNVTPEHFARILHDLVDAGLIVVDARDVKILEVAKLRNYHG